MTDLITFYTEYENPPLNTEGVERQSAQIIQSICETEEVELESLTIIWVTDAYLQKLHEEFLDDPTETDVMTFNYSESGSIDAELYISIDRARAQAPRFGASVENELQRLVIHGVLHMSGYDDGTDDERKEMRAREDFYLKT